MTSIEVLRLHNVLRNTQPDPLNPFTLLSVQNPVNSEITADKILTVFSATNTYATRGTTASTRTIFYYNFQMTFELVNQQLSTTGQYALYLFLAAYGTNLQDPIFRWQNQILDVLVCLESNGNQMYSPIFQVDTLRDMIQWGPTTPGSTRTPSVPIFLSNLFPNMIQNADIIYKVSVTILTRNPPPTPTSEPALTL